MIRHIVLIKFKSGIDQNVIDSLFDALADLGREISGMRGFDGGVSVSPENLEQGFRHGFCIDFDHEAARDAYLAHPTHQALGAELVKAAEGEISGLMVFDLII
ncbi:Dabb family protein [Thalassospira lucentensis]|uniref:Stress responsive protein n=1 Tax=Thalassospira lucentensis TaxID=168935 RepID=A0A358HX42_9PROT|nr:Dabb family protein [Thalassospira lucentensis]HBU99708.1 stress responsive protein [Thalassospira lucentensis]HCW66379.1 stress responsive protein [Thalassospira lucentensis]|tara:strand:+ start:3651 stop:3959 length:309 start_codon:yes stop_codon:yes gene_type:complete